ncbi:MAG TPA: hypothetical protein VHU92_23580, partial [Streptosporangiaceae bacterium]|nr:hypothetical protein [Streptosporangiaceae bacterium]
MSHRRVAPGKESKLSADQTPSSPATGTEPAAGTRPGLPRLFFPEEPAVPPQGAPPPQGPPQSVPPQGTPPPPPGLAPPPSGTWQAPPPPGTWQAPPPPGAWQPPPSWQPPGPPAPARAQRPTEQPRRELRHRAAAAMIFGLLSLLALSATGEVTHAGYLIAFALVIGLAALVLGITAARRARLEDTMRPRGSVAAIILGSVAIA